MSKTALSDLLESWDAGAWGEPATNINNGVSVLRSTNFREGGSLCLENKSILSIDEQTLHKKRLQIGDILLERSGGGPLQPVGRVAMFQEKNNDRFICGNFISRLVPRREVVDPWYLMYQLLAWHVLGITERFQTATTGIRNLQLREYLKKELTVPNLPEQQKIAANLKTQLTEVEKIRQAVEQQHKEIRALKAKSLISTFSSIENLRPIGEVSKVQSGYAFKSQEFVSTGVRLLRNTNISPGRVYWDDAVCLSELKAEAYPTYALNDGDVLISLDRPLISDGVKVARVSQADLPSLLVQRVGRFHIDREMLDPDYLYAYMQTEMFISRISGHDQSLGVPHISPGQIEAIEIPLPDVDKQRELAKTLSQLDEQIYRMQGAVNEQFSDIEQLAVRVLANAFEM